MLDLFMRMSPIDLFLVALFSAVSMRVIAALLWSREDPHRKLLHTYAAHPPPKPTIHGLMTMICDQIPQIKFVVVTEIKNEDDSENAPIVRVDVRLRWWTLGLCSKSTRMAVQDILDVALPIHVVGVVGVVSIRRLPLEFEQGSWE